MPEYLKASVVAKELGVAPSTVKRWAKLGKVKAVQTPGGYWLIDAEVLEELGHIGRLCPGRRGPQPDQEN